jgi:hypothetical protein
MCGIYCVEGQLILCETRHDVTEQIDLVTLENGRISVIMAVVIQLSLCMLDDRIDCNNYRFYELHKQFSPTPFCLL